MKVGSPEFASVVDIQDIPVPYTYTGHLKAGYEGFPQLDITVRKADLVASIKPVFFKPTVASMDGDDPNGSRLMFGFFITPKDKFDLGSIRHPVSTIAGPSQFSLDYDEIYTWDINQERRLLEVTAAYPMGMFVNALPGAMQEDRRIYEQGLAGITMGSAVSIISKSLKDGHLSPAFAKILLTRMYDSVAECIASMHDAEITHHHLHLENIIINPATCMATIVDLTRAVSKDHPDTQFKTDHGRLKYDPLVDYEEFHKDYRRVIQENGLEDALKTDITGLYATDDALDRVIIAAALRRIGLPKVGQNNITRIQAARGFLISTAPDIKYPRQGQRKLRMRIHKVVPAISRLLALLRT